MSLGSSSRRYPTASFAATRAIGNPVAFDASALLRLTRGFISMTTHRPSRGFCANCTFAPPVSTPIARITFRLASRIHCHSRSVSVCAGATVRLSPVCTPIGSTFSIEHTMHAWSARSRITSISNSFQPSSDSSISTSCTGLSASPAVTIDSSSAASCAIPPPAPPSVNPGRTTTGHDPIPSCTACASSRLCALPDRGTASPASAIAALKSPRSSALRITSARAPMSSTRYRASTPASSSATARFSAVCPPMVGSSASGRSRRMMAVSASTVSGSMYVWSANSGSVMMVAGLLLTSTTSYPSSRSALQAWAPE